MKVSIEFSFIFKDNFKGVKTFHTLISLRMFLRVHRKELFSYAFQFYAIDNKGNYVSLSEYPFYMFRSISATMSRITPLYHISEMDFPF